MNKLECGRTHCKFIHMTKSEVNLYHRSSPAIQVVLIPELLRTGQYRGVCQQWQNNGACSKANCRKLHNKNIEKQIQCFVCLDLLKASDIAVLETCKHVLCITCYMKLLAPKRVGLYHSSRARPLEDMMIECPFCKKISDSYMTINQ